MPEPGTKIETGVDKLVKLVAREKKVSIEDAAKELGVPITLVQEWADFLEEEGLLDTEYSLSKSYLLEKRMSRDDVKEKSKEYGAKKDAFVRKVDTALERLDNEAEVFGELKDRYYAIKDRLGEGFSEVQQEIADLHHYEDLKKTIDADILAQKHGYQQQLERIHSSIDAEEQRYQKMIGEIQGEEKQLGAEGAEMGALAEQETGLLKRIDALQMVVEGVTSKLGEESTHIRVHQERLAKLRAMAHELETEIEKKKKNEVDPLVKVSDDQSKRILRIQDEIFEKVKARHDKLEGFEKETEDLQEHFADFFDRRAEIEEAMRDIEALRLQMKSELVELVTKAKAFDLTVKSVDTNNYIKELEVKFREFDQKKKEFTNRMEQLKQQLVKTDIEPEVPLPPLPAQPPPTK